MREIKTIKGKVDILAFPVGADGKTTNRRDDMTIRSLYYQMPWFYLSKATEEQCSLLVDFDNDDNHKDYLVSKSCYQLKTAKESLFSLLKANGCWIKGWMDEPNINEFKSIPFCESGECSAYFDVVSEYNKTPDDYLLIIKQ